MLNDIKAVQGINHNDFDTIIDTYINAGIADLKAIGIAESKVVTTDPLIYAAVFAYVLSFLDVKFSEMYTNSYNLQKDTLRHLSEYQNEEGINEGE